MRKSIQQNDQLSVELSQLPKKWRWSCLGDLGMVRLGKTPRKIDYCDQGDYKIVKFRDVDETGNIDWDNDDKGYVNSSPDILKALQELKEGDVLVTASAHMSEHIGKKVGLALSIPRKYKGTFVVGELLRIRTMDGVDPRWVYYYLGSREGYKAIQRRVQGVHLIGSRAQHIEIPLAPPEDQQRILPEIEKQFSRLDEAVANLKRVKANLKRYKAAILKAAVEGKLISSDARSWIRTNLGAVLTSIEAGKSFKCEERTPNNHEIGVVKVSAVTWGTYNEEESKTCLDSDRIETRYFVRPGDFLFSRANTIELVGACVIAQKVTLKIMLSDKILRFRFSKEIVPQWVLYWLRSDIGRKEIQRLSTGNQESMRNIGQDRIRQITLVLPSLHEQQQIVAEVERRLSVIDELEATVESNFIRANRLRQAVLKEAFCGNLSAKNLARDQADSIKD